jgi:phosphatidylserine decarboxylase
MNFKQKGMQSKMPSYISREGNSIVLITLSIAVALLIFSCLVSSQSAAALRISSSAVFLLLIFTIVFFRDPERKTDYDSNALISPADGTIVDIREVNEPQYLKKTVKRISIFMSLFDVHVNRSPVNGTVEFLKYNPGKFISAFKDKASEDNESLFVGIQSREPSKKIGVKFIAGLIARRIVFYKKLNDAIGQGERINIIKFGSRVDVFCPDSSEIKIRKGDRVTAGQSVIAVLKD